MTSAGIESTFPDEESPLELTVNNEAFFLADTEPMGVVAEVIRNDMGDSLGIIVYDDTTRQVHKFRSSQLVVRPDGNVTVLPSWFKRSREILRNIEPMEQAVPAIKRARKKGIRLSEEEAAQATSDAPAEVQRYIDEAVILRSQLIRKLHGLFQKQTATDAQLRDLGSPGLFDRTSVEDRRLQISTLKRSHRLNLQTINAMRDFLVHLDTSYLFPKDPRYRALFNVEEFKAIQEAAPAEGTVDEFETFEEADELPTFEEADEFESFEEADEFPTFEDIPEMETFPEEPPLPPPPPMAATAVVGAAVATAPVFHDVEALPDMDEVTISQPSLMAVGAPGWTPPQPGATGVAPMAEPTSAPPPPPGAVHAVPPPPMPSMEEFEATGQRKINGEMAEPEPVAKKAGLLGRLRKGREKQSPPVAAAAVAGAAAGGAVAYAATREPEEFTPVDEFETFEDVRMAPEAPPTFDMPPPPFIPPPPSYTSHAEGLAIDSFQEVPPTEEFTPIGQAAPPVPPTVVQPPPVPAPMPVTAPPAAPAPAPAPTPEPVETFEEAEEFATFEEEVEAQVPEADKPLDAEKDIDAILAMALGKAPTPGSRPTAKPGVREEKSTSMGSLLSKTKYRRGD